MQLPDLKKYHHCLTIPSLPSDLSESRRIPTQQPDVDSCLSSHVTYLLSATLNSANSLQHFICWVHLLLLKGLTNPLPLPGKAVWSPTDELGGRLSKFTWESMRTASTSNPAPPSPLSLWSATQKGNYLGKVSGGSGRNQQKIYTSDVANTRRSSRYCEHRGIQRASAPKPQGNHVFP